VRLCHGCGTFLILINNAGTNEGCVEGIRGVDLRFEWVWWNFQSVLLDCFIVGFIILNQLLGIFDYNDWSHERCLGFALTLF
jgi:hypothetical protein